jgi:hypothetical protein
MAIRATEGFPGVNTTISTPEGCLRAVVERPEFTKTKSINMEETEVAITSFDLDTNTLAICAVLFVLSDVVHT